MQYREPPKSVPPYFTVPGTAAVPPKNEVPGTAKKYRQVEILHRMCPPGKHGTEEDPGIFEIEDGAFFEDEQYAKLFATNISSRKYFGGTGGHRDGSLLIDFFMLLFATEFEMVKYEETKRTERIG